MKYCLYGLVAFRNQYSEQMIYEDLLQKQFRKNQLLLYSTIYIK